MGSVPMFVRRRVVRAMLVHARRAAPHECCGLLSGTAHRVELASQARNTAETPATRYLVEPADHFAALKQARRTGREIVGAYHSHPASLPMPSSTDRADAHPDFLYVIVSLVDCRRRIRGWRLERGNFVEVRLVIVS